MLRRADNNEVILNSSDNLGSFLEICEKRSLALANAVGVVLDNKKLIGLITSGDVLKALSNKVSYGIPVADIANKKPVFVFDDEHNGSVKDKLKSHKFLPKLDASNENYLGLFCQYTTGARFEVMNGVFADESSIVFIAEIGNNHNGSISRAKELIDEMSAAGADIVKFQHRSLENLYTDDESSNLGAEYVIDLVEKYALTIEQLSECFQYAQKLGLGVMCTPWDQVALEELEKDGCVQAYKIASADMTNLPLISDVAATGKNLILSTGMSASWEIIETIDHLRSLGANYALLHCNSAYPPPYEDLNLNFISTLKELGSCQVGYSGHERGYHCVLGVAALGARIIEKHVTLDRRLEGTDHKISMLPNEFKKMVDECSDLLSGLGSGVTRSISQGEKLNRVALSKSAFLKTSLKKGQTLNTDHIIFKSPGDGIQPNQISRYFGLAISQNLKAGQMLQPTFFGEPIEQNCEYKFKRLWGVPVRHRDVDFFSRRFASPLLEVHFSYRDLDLDHSKYFSNKPLDREIIYHAPELFEGDHVMDLTSDNLDYRQNSQRCLQKTIDTAVKIHKLQGLSSTPKLVLNCGGFSELNFLSNDKKSTKIKLLIETLKSVDPDICKILPQTMPPFPWHFGGKRYHNLMTTAENIIEICKGANLKMCLDLSHSFMWCKHSSTDFYEFIMEIRELVSHIHVSDSSSVTDEGLQIGQGNIDFKEVDNSLNGFGETFIVEIWQGHEDQGRGFADALKKLEGLI